MEIKIKIENKELLLDDWTKLINHNILGGLAFRRNLHLSHRDTTSFIGLYLRSKGMRTENSVYYWGIWFRGIFNQLQLIYDQIYSNPPQFISDQYLEAQDHIDEFLNKYNSLKAFL